MKNPLSVSNIIATLLGIVLATPIVGFFSLIWQKSNYVDKVEEQVLKQKAVAEELVNQLATVKAQISSLQKNTNARIEDIPAETWLQAEEAIQQSIDKKVYRAKN